MPLFYSCLLTIDSRISVSDYCSCAISLTSHRITSASHRIVSHQPHIASHRISLRLSVKSEKNPNPEMKWYTALVSRTCIIVIACPSSQCES